MVNLGKDNRFHEIHENDVRSHAKSWSVTIEEENFKEDDNQKALKNNDLTTKKSREVFEKLIKPSNIMGKKTCLLISP